MSYDPLNPHERKRSGEIPVGFKNIGNTCWFSSVIQVRIDRLVTKMVLGLKPNFHYIYSYLQCA